MEGCCIHSVYRREERRKERENLFFELMNTVWHDDIQGTVEILSKDPTLTNYRQFDFHLPNKTNSILDYAKVLSRKDIIQVLLGFGARSGTS